MKRTTTLLLAALLLTACADTQPEAVAVRFDIGGVQSGPLTKATSVGAAIAETATYGTPTVTLTSKTNPARVLTIPTGQEASVPVDTYTATIDYAPAAVGTCTLGSVYATPTYAVSEDVRVIPDKDRYTLTARFTCFAIAIDHTDAAGYGIKDGDTYPVLEYAGTTGYEVRYIKPEGSGTTTLRAYASDPTSRDDRDYTLGWGGTSAEVTLAVANWYLFPTQAVEQAWGTFGLSFGSFHEGFSGY